MNRVTQRQVLGREPTRRRLTQREVLLFAGLVSLGAGLRLVFRDIPNFAPVAAIALFAGYCFRRTAVAAAVPLVIMLISDFFIGAYSWQMMALVYAALILPAVCGPVLRNSVRFNQVKSVWRPLAALLTCSLGASLIFFAVTNFGSWLWFNSYAKDWSGLVSCYTAAIPFFRYTLAGDLTFAVILFGSYATAVYVNRQRTTSPATAPLV